MSIINELNYHCSVNKCGGLLHSRGNPTRYDWAMYYSCVTCGSNIYICTECNNSADQNLRRPKNRFQRHRLSRHNKVRHDLDALEKIKGKKWMS